MHSNSGLTMQLLHNAFVPIRPDVSAFLKSEKLLFVGNEWVAPCSSEYFATANPSTGETLTKVASAGSADVDAAVKCARDAFDTGPWPRMLPGDREALIRRLADLIERDAPVFAQLDSLDNGKPYTTVLNNDVPRSVQHLRYFAGWPTKIQGATIPVGVANCFNYTLREPVGVCGLIIPWNYPLRMAIWKIAPALAAGNCVILKPAEQTPLSALYLAQLGREAGFPPGVLNVLTGFGETTGAALVNHPGVNKIGFTGSTQVARSIIRSSAADLKRISLELGGKSPNIIFADADLPKAVKGAMWAAFGNLGQSCAAASRLYVHSRIYDEVVAGLAREVDTLRVGPGMLVEQPDLGPVISSEQLSRVLSYVDIARRDGGEVVTGGKRIGGHLSTGFFVEPTIFAGVPEKSKAMTEEIFGPVLCVTKFDDIDDVVARANDSDYGLSAGIWTTDLATSQSMAKKLRAGTVWVNMWGMTDPASPFGGLKQSGYGREMGWEGIELYTEIKSVWINAG